MRVREPVEPRGDPEGELVVAREITCFEYETVTGTVCHNRYVIVPDDLWLYWNVELYWRYAGDEDWALAIPQFEQIVLDGDPIGAWVWWWMTCEGGWHNDTVEWHAIGDTWEEDGVFIAEGSWTIKNTTVSSDNVILRFDPDNSELSECEISWTTDHLDEGIIGVKGPIYIRNLAGHVVYTHMVEEAPLGEGSWIWDGSIDECPYEPGGPTEAPKGIYTYNVGDPEWAAFDHINCVRPGGWVGCGRGDADKSENLEITHVHVSNFEWVELPTKAQVTLDYELTWEAADCELKVYNHDLEEVTVETPANGELDGTAGPHNDVVVQFTDPAGIADAYSFVVFARDTEENADIWNRDRQPKPALQRGAVHTEWPNAVAALGDGIGSGNYDLSDVVGQMGAYDEDATRYVVTGYVSPSAKSVRDRLEDSAVAYLRAHSTPTLMGFGSGGGLRGGVGDDDPGNDKYYVSNIDGSLSHMLFALCMGCSTAQWEGGVPAAIVDKGATAAMGFTSDVLPPQGWTFSNYFFEEALEPSSTVLDAAIHALDKVDDKHDGDYGGTINLSWIGPTSISLRPARWGE